MKTVLFLKHFCGYCMCMYVNTSVQVALVWLHLVLGAAPPRRGVVLCLAQPGR